MRKNNKDILAEIGNIVEERLDKTQDQQQQEAIKKANAYLSKLKKERHEVPIDVFPEPIQEFIMTYYDFYKFPIEYYFTSVLTIAGTVIGNTYAAKYHNSWWASPLMWSILVGGSSSGKSQVMGHCDGVLKDIQKRYIIDNDVRIQQWEQEKLEKSLSKLKTEDVPKPQPKQIITNKATIEAIIQLLNKNPKGILLKRGELMGWLAAFNQYSNGDTKQTYMEIWDNEELIDNKKGDGMTFIPRPFVNVLGGVQTDIIQDMAGKDNAKTGFFQRFLFALPDDDTIPMPKEGQPDFQAYEGYRKAIMWLYELPNKFVPPADDIPYSRWTIETVKLQLNKEAKALFFQYRCNCVEKMNSSDDNIIKALLGKLTTYVLRFTIVMDLLTMACNEELVDLESFEEYEIGVESVKKAIKIANYFEHTARKVTDRVESPVNRLKPFEQAWYIGLPKEEIFKTALAKTVGAKVKGMKTRNVEKLLSDNQLFKKIKTGWYERIHF